VVERTVEAMGALGAAPADVTAEIGPCIRARCYEVGADDLDTVVKAVGPEVRSATAWGTPALDVPAGVLVALARAGVEQVHDQGVCTACSPQHWSYRARGDAERQAAVAWLAS
jgi:copper oxidase (laccase) domain-containing protein